ncbi:MAG: hypothetical protein JWR54_1872 [Mucilaginibacter sp.]|nr:hypothetical protein [Mucilaginibacter sp.]
MNLFRSSVTNKDQCTYNDLGIRPTFLPLLHFRLASSKLVRKIKNTAKFIASPECHTLWV